MSHDLLAMNDDESDKLSMAGEDASLSKIGGILLL